MNCARNWSDYNKSLVKRGDLTLWITPSVIESINNESSSGRGRAKRYSDTLIEACILIKNAYQLTFRAVEGFLKSLYQFMGIKAKVPDYSTLCRRQTKLNISLSKRKHKDAMVIIVDSTGLKMIGEGEWCAQKHGYHYQRTWRKVHLAVDANSLDIVSCAMSSSRTQDSDMLEPLLQTIPGSIRELIGDGAYDTFKCYESAKIRNARCVITPQSGARLSKETPYHKKPASLEAVNQRDEIISEIREKGRKAWKVDSGYHRRSLVETTMFRLKTILGERLKSRNKDNQLLEVRARCKILNMMNQIVT